MAILKMRDKKWSLLEYPDVTLCFIGYTGDQSLVFFVRSKVSITHTQMFPEGSIVGLSNTNIEYVPLVCKAFEYGRYTTLESFLKRKTQNRRSTSTRCGILTCTE